MRDDWVEQHGLFLLSPTNGITIENWVDIGALFVVIDEK